MTEMPRPRVLVTTTTLPRWDGDTEPRFVLDLAIAMGDSYDVTILAPRSPGTAREGVIEGIRICRYRYAPLRRWEVLAAPGAIMPNIRKRPLLGLLVPFLIVGQAIALSRLLRRERFDAVHCHWLIPQGLVYAAISLLGRCPPALLTCHGGDAFTLNRWPFRALKAWAVRRMAGVTAVSGEIVDYLSALTGLDGPAAEHIPMGVDLARFRPAQPRSLAEQSAPTILFVGRLAEKKGLPVLLEALRGPDLTRLGAVLRVVGDGPLRGDLEGASRDLAAAGRIHFAGALPHDALAAEFAGAKLFCAPFVIAADGDREGTPTVLMEAASSGIPIVASDIGGCRDIIVPGVSGWLVPSGDAALLAAALTEALSDPEAAQRFAGAARDRVEGFGWRLIGQRYAEAVDAIVTERI